MTSGRGPIPHKGGTPARLGLPESAPDPVWCGALPPLRVGFLPPRVPPAAGAPSPAAAPSGAGPPPPLRGAAPSPAPAGGPGPPPLPPASPARAVCGLSPSVASRWPPCAAGRPRFAVASRFGRPCFVSGFPRALRAFPGGSPPGGPCGLRARRLPGRGPSPPSAAFFRPGPPALFPAAAPPAAPCFLRRGFLSPPPVPLRGSVRPVGWASPPGSGLRFSQPCPGSPRAPAGPPVRPLGPG